MWDLVVSVPDHCLSFNFSSNLQIFRTYIKSRFEFARDRTIRFGIASINVVWPDVIIHEA